jgi:predicted RND superfamily exporter protein
VVLLSLGALLGTMALLGQKISPPTQILPTFQLTVGIAYPIHFLAMFFRELRSGASREDAVAHAIGHSGLPIVMTALTTAGGMASFVTAALYPIAVLGYLVPFGVLLALLFSLVLLPGLVMVVPLRAASADRRDGADTPIDRFLLACGHLSLRHPRALVAGTLAISVVSGIAALSLRFSHDPVDDWMPEGDVLRVATHVLNDHMGGVTSLDVLVRTGRENGLHEPAVLDGIDRLRAWAEGREHEGVTVTRATSLVDIVKETNRALNENRAETYAIPRERDLVAQELLLFENSGADDLERIVDSRFETARVTLRLPWGDAVDFYHFVRELEARVPELVGPGVTTVITGLVGMMSRTLMAVMESMAWSYVTSLVIVTLLMTSMLGNLRGGLVSMLPNLAPIFVMHGVMVAFDVPLDALTLMAGSTVLGLAVDDTIHFIHVFRREFEQSGDSRQAVDRTLTSTGRANLFSCIVLSSGFLVFTLSSMENLKIYGWLIAFTFLLALAIELLVTPALLVTTAVGAKNVARRREALADPR